MPKPAKHYRYKLEHGPTPEVKDVGTDLPASFGQGRMLIASPLWVEDYVKTIPAGEVRTMDQLRSHLAARADADFACPLTSGIFARVVAEAAAYEQVNGLPVSAPWWRLVKSDGCLNPKFPHGDLGETELQAQLLEAEGVRLVATGRSKKLKVSLT
jgi:alkylated DNA nucleotide flippase Atl1